VLGCEGKWAIHPNQIGLANEVMSPSEADVTKARRIIAAMQEAAKARWDELREGGGLGMPEGRGRCEVVGGRARRYLKKV
jgi:malyl-CoA/(S)-citramalyl-CoA lyase